MSKFVLPYRNGGIRGEYVVPTKVLQEAQKKFPAVDLVVQMNKMIAWLNQDEARHKKEEWYPEFILNWMARAAGQKVQQSAKPSASSGGSGGDQLAAIMKEIRMINERLGAIQNFILKRAFTPGNEMEPSILDNAQILADREPGDDSDEDIGEDESYSKKSRKPALEEDELPF